MAFLVKRIWEFGWFISQLIRKSGITAWKLQFKWKTSFKYIVFTKVSMGTNNCETCVLLFFFFIWGIYFSFNKSPPFFHCEMKQLKQNVDFLLNVFFSFVPIIAKGTVSYFSKTQTNQLRVLYEKRSYDLPYLNTLC